MKYRRAGDTRGVEQRNSKDFAAAVRLDIERVAAGTVTDSSRKWWQINTSEIMSGLIEGREVVNRQRKRLVLNSAASADPDCYYAGGARSN